MADQLKRGDLVVIVRTHPDNIRFLGRIFTLGEIDICGAWSFDPPLVEKSSIGNIREWRAESHCLKKIPPLGDLEGVRSEDARKTDLGETA